MHLILNIWLVRFIPVRVYLMFGLFKCSTTTKPINSIGGLKQMFWRCKSSTVDGAGWIELNILMQLIWLVWYTWNAINVELSVEIMNKFLNSTPRELHNISWIQIEFWMQNAQCNFYFSFVWMKLLSIFHSACPANVTETYRMHMNFNRIFQKRSVRCRPLFLLYLKCHTQIHKYTHTHLQWNVIGNRATISIQRNKQRKHTFIQRLL